MRYLFGGIFSLFYGIFLFVANFFFVGNNIAVTTFINVVSYILICYWFYINFSCNNNSSGDLDCFSSEIPVCLRLMYAINPVTCDHISQKSCRYPCTGYLHKEIYPLPWSFFTVHNLILFQLAKSLSWILFIVKISYFPYIFYYRFSTMFS